MIRFILFAFVFYLIYRAIAGLTRTRDGRSGGKGSDDVQGEDLVEDPCCHTYIPVSNARKYLHDGKAVYFCSQECLEKYRSENLC